MTRLLPALALTILLTACGSEPPTNTAAADNATTADNAPASGNTPQPSPAEPLPDTVRVRLDTEDGPIVVAVDAKHAPLTAANFVSYVDSQRLDGTTFYRAAPTKGAPGKGFIQGGIRHDYTRMLPPVALEPTSKTGLKHLAGTISMAHGEGAGSLGDFFILAEAIPSFDARPGNPGYAAFGRVVSGMDTVRRILASKTIPNAGSGAMKGQMIAKPVKIVSAKRVER
jgi:peptidyl-prolyl cis-trans isomerase A (cyclophilin A)